MLIIGVLDIQGAISEHVKVIERNGFKSMLVREERHLHQIDALILPGGESTVMRKLIDSKPMFKRQLLMYVSSKPIYATCAGLILLSSEYFNTLNINVLRNGFGSQIASELTIIKWNNLFQQAAFIRAPIITEINDSNVTSIVTHKNEIVGLETNRIIAISFHPELTDDDSLFLKFVNEKIKNANN